MYYIQVMNFYELIFNSTDRSAKEIAILRHGKNTDVLCVVDKKDNHDENKRNEIIIPRNLKSKLEPLYFDAQPGFPNRYYISGASGCGKST